MAMPDGTWGYSTDAIRAERDRLLASCDFTQLPDAPLSAAQKEKWSAYRQALRDISLQAGFPNSVVWPIAPEA
ncbi:tail fiber assembly protein [Desulfovibrio subterraneus]|nr:tail fiber assembly protein [Desulfovibrio subterraneus]